MSDGRELETLVTCPACGAATPIELASIAIGEETPVVDCTICCQPMRVHTQRLPDGSAEVQVTADS